MADQFPLQSNNDCGGCRDPALTSKHGQGLCCLKCRNWLLVECKVDTARHAIDEIFNDVKAHSKTPDQEFAKKVAEKITEGLSNQVDRA